ncbi:MAG TPA: MarR family winged helix-turn-helix transcriptional regulator [Candidatus Dormibacteraeota bacterium]|nr:MarR family winged helix-turn-helix transcriptional regulator [Candidatus Dormibacteraeota bacterium]
MAGDHEVATPGFLVWRLSMKWRAAVDRAVAPLGLTHAQYSVVASLLGMERAGRRPSQRELADHTGLDPIYVSKLVRTLERAGLVERTEHPADSRAVELSLSARGRHLAGQAIEIVRDLQERLTAPLGGTRSQRTATLLRDLRTLLDAPLADRRTP